VVNYYGLILKQLLYLFWKLLEERQETNYFKWFAKISFLW
jgi:hypothetical protein